MDVSSIRQVDTWRENTTLGAQHSICAYCLHSFVHSVLKLLPVSLNKILSRSGHSIVPTNSLALAKFQRRQIDDTQFEQCFYFTTLRTGHPANRTDFLFPSYPWSRIVGDEPVVLDSFDQGAKYDKLFTQAPSLPPIQCKPHLLQASATKRNATVAHTRTSHVNPNHVKLNSSLRNSLTAISHRRLLRSLSAPRVAFQRPSLSLLTSSDPLSTCFFPFPLSPRASSVARLCATQLHFFNS
ncbi:Uncharacterized protein HZ326_5762 [Fusarium oxysporum f. sp. albedinis]|nr:Uncharacterized protein HZ326_5762 [Fusarium oxysporum f. sp. albedinis]